MAQLKELLIDYKKMGNSKQWKKLILVLLFSTIAVSLIVSYFQDSRKDRLLKNNNRTFAILIHSHDGTAVRAISYGVFIFRDKDNKKIKFEVSGDYTKLEIGDTVLIEYAVEDHSIARVIDKYYMQKYRHLKEKEAR